MEKGFLGVGLVSLTIFFEFLCSHSDTGKADENSRITSRSKGCAC